MWLVLRGRRTAAAKRTVALAFVAAGRRGEVTRTGATISTLVAMSAVAAGAISYANLDDGDLAAS
jgi:hypothetical protein